MTKSENIVAKGEIARFEQSVYMRERVNVIVLCDCFKHQPYNAPVSLHCLGLPVLYYF